ncbi:hypothetical protein PRIPAC_79813 [Pristionchus pacificus]|uniref:Pabp-2 n=1 Tax=Pristionchus pacificus TaxID=54126 RepID=A0A454Y0D1_PRIPA|nr:hypothetical protein PRIPAC_79813 [Pristionchus pacificus]|eukprot:PDM70752.1 pabp-2 [Pristionchus pacificus]
MSTVNMSTAENTVADNNSSSAEMMTEEELQRKLDEINEEQALARVQSWVDTSLDDSKDSTGASAVAMSAEEKAAADGRSVYVGNVDYSCTAEELEGHFHGCGSVTRVTIQCDKFTRHPKGFAYVEFSDAEGRDNAIAMNDSLLKGRQIKVVEKRTNRPGISTTNRGGRGGGRGRGRVIYVPVYAGGRGARGMMRGMRGMRGRGRPM